MIDLRFKADFSWNGASGFDACFGRPDRDQPEGYSAQIEPMLAGGLLCRSEFGSFSFTPEQADSFDGDIVFASRKKVVLRGCSGQTASTTRSR